MITAKHTPGPWSVLPNYAKAYFTVFDGDGNFGELDHDTISANARLIACAPELLEVLQKWEVFMLANYKPEDISWFAETQCAIAKATGAA